MTSSFQKIGVVVAPYWLWPCKKSSPNGLSIVSSSKAKNIHNSPLAAGPSVSLSPVFLRSKMHKQGALNNSTGLLSLQRYGF
ncbi:hypothetical protein ACHQM5_011026 [Ranunculus cassubicifolius]